MADKADAPGQGQTHLDGPFVAAELAWFLQVESLARPGRCPAPRNQSAGDGDDLAALRAVFQRLAAGAPEALEFERLLLIELAYENDELSTAEAYRLRALVTLMDAATGLPAG